jgi:hypothetical protein
MTWIQTIHQLQSRAGGICERRTMAPLNSSTAELEKSLFSVRPHPQNNVRVGPTAPATFAFASVPRSRKAARKKTSRTKSPKISSARIC